VQDVFRGPIKAALAAAFLVGLVLLFLNPPSLSGAEGMAVLIGGALALLLLTAWGTVVLTGRDGMTEPEFERLVRRSEELGREPGLRAQATDFDLLVAEAIDRLPEDFQRLLDNVPVVVSHRGAENRAYGHYFGDTVARDDYPDRIVLYQDTLERDFGYDPDLLRAQVERGVRELGL
jgi:NAD(P)-dependent dehydrogenase (short-subunit alcohol dehydrogenase family)